MSDGRLLIGTRRYSSWSLRGWLAVRLAGLDVKEQVIPLAGGHTEAVARATPTGMVPYLEHRGARVWESLAIGEYCAEFEPSLWPGERIARCRARSLASEMHAGFRALRLAMPMNCGRSASPLRDGITPDAAADIDRIQAIWNEAAGPYVFGPGFTIADVMFAPVVSRVLSYDVPLTPRAARYRDAVRAHPLMIAWYEAASAEPLSWRLDHYEGVG